MVIGYHLLQVIWLKNIFDNRMFEKVRGFAELLPESRVGNRQNLKERGENSDAGRVRIL
jgi:hypothetical protein